MHVVPVAWVGFKGNQMAKHEVCGTNPGGKTLLEHIEITVVAGKNANDVI